MVVPIALGNTIIAVTAVVISERKRLELHREQLKVKSRSLFERKLKVFIKILGNINILLHVASGAVALLVGTIAA